MTKEEELEEARKIQKWLNNAHVHGGSFVSTFAKAIYCADEENYQVLKPILLKFMEKYPNYSTEFWSRK